MKYLLYVLLVQVLLVKVVESVESTNSVDGGDNISLQRSLRDVNSVLLNRDEANRFLNVEDTRLLLTKRQHKDSKFAFVNRRLGFFKAVNPCLKKKRAVLAKIGKVIVDAFLEINVHHAQLVNTRTKIVITANVKVVLRVVVVLNLLLVQKQQIERVKVANRENIKIPIHIPVHLAKVVLLNVV